jgi:hypothetical protein
MPEHNTLNEAEPNFYITSMSHLRSKNKMIFFDMPSILMAVLTDFIVYSILNPAALSPLNHVLPILFYCFVWNFFYIPLNPYTLLSFRI